MLNKIMKYICYDGTTINVEIPDYIKRIGIMFSGGFDSSLLLYILAKEKRHDQELISFTVPNNITQADVHAKRIVSWITDRTNTSITFNIIGDGSAPHKELVMSPSREIIKQKLVDKLYSGVNQNPPIEFQIPGPERRNPNISVPDHIGLPFISLYKTHILELYQHLDILELANITFSCTEQPENRCNKCFQCMERNWAYQTLNLTDHGI
jgi:7-cyano-7-deazaguanine synthase in queuosine biosynthesis